MIRRLGLITCKQAHQMLSQRMDEPLSTLAGYRLRLHLAICGACSRVDRQFSMMRQAMRRLGD